VFLSCLVVGQFMTEQQIPNSGSHATPTTLEGEVVSTTPEKSVKEKVSIEKITQLTELMKEVEQQLIRLRKEGLASAPPHKVAPPETDQSNPMTGEEKAKLLQALQNLTEDDMFYVASIIGDSFPQFAEINADEVEIDINSLDNSTLRDIESYIRQSNIDY